MVEIVEKGFKKKKEERKCSKKFKKNYSETEGLVFLS